MTHRHLNIALAVAIAAIACLAPVVMDTPSDIQAARDTQASVLDAQADAAAAAHHSTLIASQDQP